MQICFLHECPQQLAAVAKLMHDAFGTRENYNAFETLLQNSLTPAQLPLCVVAIDGGEAVGAIGILRADLISRQDLYPWIGNVVVRPDRRGEGIGLAMLRHSAEACRALGFSRIYLYTKLNGYYEKLGWTHFADAPEQDGTMQKLYSLAL